MQNSPETDLVMELEDGDQHSLLFDLSNIRDERTNISVHVRSGQIIKILGQALAARVNRTVR